MLTKILLTLAMLNPASNYANIKNISDNLSSRATENLEDLIKNTDLGKLKDPSKQLINSKIEENYQIDSEQLEFTNLTYSGVRINAKQNSKDYTGSKYLRFDSELTYNFTGRTKNISKEAYNSTQKDQDILEIKYTPEFGKVAFTDYFKSVEFEWMAVTYDNGLSGKGGNRNHNKDVRKDGTKEDISPLRETHSITNQSMEYTELYNRVYSKTNSMKSYGYFGYEWKGNTISLNFKVEVTCYATAWNALWARAENQLHIYNLKFVK